MPDDSETVQLHITRITIRRVKPLEPYATEHAEAEAVLHDGEDPAATFQALRRFVADQLAGVVPIGTIYDSPAASVVEPSYRQAPPADPPADRRPVGQNPLDQARDRLRDVRDMAGLDSPLAMWHIHWLLDRNPLDPAQRLNFKDLTEADLRGKAIPYLEQWALAREQATVWAKQAGVDLGTVVRQVLPDIGGDDELLTLHLSEWQRVGAELRAGLIRAQIAPTVLRNLPDNTVPGDLADFLDAVPARAPLPAPVAHRTPAPLSAPPLPAVRTADSGAPRPVPGPGKVTEKQLKAIYAIAKNARHLTAAEVDARCQELYGCAPADLEKRDASEFIDTLKGESSS